MRSPSILPIPLIPPRRPDVPRTVLSRLLSHVGQPGPALTPGPGARTTSREPSLSTATEDSGLTSVGTTRTAGGPPHSPSSSALHPQTSHGSRRRSTTPTTGTVGSTPLESCRRHPVRWQRCPMTQQVRRTTVGARAAVQRVTRMMKEVGLGCSSRHVRRRERAEREGTAETAPSKSAIPVAPLHCAA